MKITRKEASSFEKHGVQMYEYVGKETCPDADLLFLEVNGGHYQEFRHSKSTFIYYVIEGTGTFYLDGEPHPVEPTDTIVAPPGTAIYYLGHMKLLLTCAPAWEEEYEEHIRYISKK